MKKELKFNNGKFKIMCLGDIHEKVYHNTEDDKKRLDDMHKLLREGVNRFKPDLVVLMGDNCGLAADAETADDFSNALEEILKPVISAGIPFCCVFGNHEHDRGHEEDMVKGYENVESFIGVNDTSAPRGYFNGNLLVKDSAGKEDILNLWFIDSNNLCDDRSVSHYDWVHRDQIEWYERKAAEIKEAHGGKTIPAILFQHIPVIEEYKLLREARFYEIPFAVKGYGKFSDKYYVLKDGVKGYLGEGPCSPAVNYGQFESWKKTGDVYAAFFGHDHLNDFCGEVDGILLAQNKTAGFRVYTDGCRSAIRMITVNEDQPDKLETELYHFKELGLKCTCLGPFNKRLSDRQSINLHIAAYTAGAAAGIISVPIIAKHIIRYFKNNK